MDKAVLNIKMIVAYDGGRYLGWQKTQEGASVEGTLQQVLEQILQERITLQAASRTDAAVHAQGQVVNFISEKNKKEIDFTRLQRSINKLLPSDIVVREISEAPLSFHPTLDCIGKEYRYSICTATVQLPQYRHYSWHYSYKMDLNEMHRAAKHLTGKHDFAAFCNFKKNDSYEDYIREVTEIEIQECPDKRLCIRIQGNNFLYKMVRNIVGTISYTGQGKIRAEEIPNILNSQDRTLAGITAPAHGLSLHQVFYR